MSELNTFPIEKLFSLGKSRRLKGRKKIQELFSRGRVITQHPLRVVYGFTDEGASLQAGFSVSKKRFKKAVDRNRIKRILREAWRLNTVNLRQGMEQQNRRLAVFLIYTGNDMPHFRDIEYHLREIIQKLMVIRPETDR